MRWFVLLGTVAAAGAHAEEVEWKPAAPRPGAAPAATLVITGSSGAAARIGPPQPLPLPRVLPDAVADGPRLLPPTPVAPEPSSSAVVLLPPRAPAPVVEVEPRPTPAAIPPGPEFRRQSPSVSTKPAAAPRPYRPQPTLTPEPRPAAVPPPAPSQAPAFRLLPKRAAKKP